MKIGIYDPYLDDLGGGEKYMMTIAQCLSKKHDVSVFWDRKEDLNPLLSRFSIDLSSVSIVANIFDKKVSTLKRFGESKKYDYIIVLSDGSISLVSSKLLVHIQQPLPSMQAGSLLGRMKVSRVKHFFSNSNYTKNFIEKRFAIKTKVIFPPVELKPKNLPKENFIFTVCRFRTKNFGNSDSKKQSVMVDEFKRMIDGGLKGWRFILATSVWDREMDDFMKLRKKASGYPIEFLINKSNDELWEYYSKAKIYWHATGYGEDLEKNPEYAEHFGISTIEAMGAGAVPVVISAGGQKEIVTEGREGYLWKTLPQLRQKTQKLIQDPSQLEKMSVESRKRAKYFADQDFCGNIDKLLK